MFQSLLKKGFTLVELIVSVGIFVVMTSILVVKYGNFNQSVLLTNLAYDVALTLRTAQTYGVSVTNQNNSNFMSAYGVNLSTQTNSNTKVTLFADANANHAYDGPSELVGLYNITRGAIVSNICVGASSSSCNSVTTLNILFKRPDPSALIYADGGNTKYEYAAMTIHGTDGSDRQVTVFGNGQISVIKNIQ